jgi:hypothetical protein
MSVKLKIKYADPVSNKFEIEAGRSKLLARREGPEIQIFKSGQDSPVGYIYIGGTNSGAIYIGNNIIGEYQTKDNHYIIRPINSGRLDPHKVVETSPIDFLVSHLIQT